MCRDRVVRLAKRVCRVVVVHEEEGAWLKLVVHLAFNLERKGPRSTPGYDWALDVVQLQRVNGCLSNGNGSCDEGIGTKRPCVSPTQHPPTPCLDTARVKMQRRRIGHGSPRDREMPGPIRGTRAQSCSVRACGWRTTRYARHNSNASEPQRSMARAQYEPPSTSCLRSSADLTCWIAPWYTCIPPHSSPPAAMI